MNRPVPFARALVQPSAKRVIFAMLLAAVGVGLLFVPLLNIPVVLAAFPLMMTFPEFGQTSADVEWWHFGPLLKSPRAFAFFSAYFFVLAYLLLFRLGRRALQAG